MPMPSSLAPMALALLLVPLAPAARTALAQSSAAFPTGDAARPAALTRSDLRALRWIVGTWRGTGTTVAPFYERYRFSDDSTLVTESFADSTLAVVSETTRWELRGGRLENGGEGARWVAVQLTPAGITFAPVRRARNAFTWRPGASKDEWHADIIFPAAAAGAAPRVVTYRMARVAQRGNRD